MRLTTMTERVAIGLMRHRVTIETPQRIADGAGGAVQTWTPVAEVWASVRPTSGSESFAADALSGRVTHEIWIRRRSDLVPGMRFRQGVRHYEIHAALDVEARGRFHRCLCEERDL